MEQVALEVFIRDRFGKGGARYLRRSEKIPAIFYGPESAPIPIYVPKLNLEKILKKQASENVLYQLTIKGDNRENVKTAMLKELQKHPVTRAYFHADFLEVSLTKEIDVTVGLRIIGKSPALEKGGIVQEISRELEIRCLPTSIPAYIDVDVSSLEIGDSLHVRDLRVPDGIRILSEPQLTLVTVAHAMMEEKPEVAEAPAEGEVEVVAKKGKPKTEEEG